MHHECVKQQPGVHANCNSIQTSLQLHSIFNPADINECTGVHSCQQLCVNTEGSYTCNCMDGFTLAEDGRNCTGGSLTEYDL